MPNLQRQLVVFLLVVGALVGGVLLMLYDSRDAYPIPPRQFFAQVGAIKPGITLDEVRQSVRLFTGEEQTSDSLIFVLEPRERPPGWMPQIPAVHFYINITLDRDGRVARVDTSDG